MGSYTANFNLYKPAIDETCWGDKVNQNFDIIDEELTANKILEKLKNVGGSGSGLDADLLDGKHASDFLPVSTDSAISAFISGNQWLSVATSGIVSLPKQSFVHVYMNNGGADFSVSAYTWTKVPFDTKIGDVQNEFDTTNHRFTASQDGVYFISVVINVKNVVDLKGYRLTIYKNGNSWTWWRLYRASGGATQSLVFPIAVKLSEGDYIEAFIYGESDFSILYGLGNALMFVAKIA